MLTYDLSRAPGPLYEYLYQCIKKDIRQGVLAAGEQLPSKRNFARNLGISTITVETAYDQLISEGYLYTVPKKGYFVADISEIFKIKPLAKTAAIPRPQPQKEYEFDLSNHHVSPENFPFSIWAKLMRETISEKKEELMAGSPGGGTLFLREAIASHLHSFRGMEADPGQIIVGAGTEYLYSILIQLFGREKRYCVENPGYQKIAQIYRSNDADCRFAAMDGQGITVDGLKKAQAEIVHISPTHHFPTGITMPVSRRYELLAWANEQEGRYIIEDDYDSEFRLNGRPIPPMQSIDIREKVVYVNTFSKSLAPTIRISYMVLPPHLAERFYERLSFYSCTVSNFEQYTLAQFIKKGYFEKHINRMRLFYARQRKEVLECIKKSPLSSFCNMIEKDSGLHFLLCFQTELCGKELKKRFQEKKIHFASLADYDQAPDCDDPPVFILNYSNIDLEKLAAALEKISLCLHE